MLAQNHNDLLLSERVTLHCPSLQQGRTLILRGGKTQWQVTQPKRSANLYELRRAGKIPFTLMRLFRYVSVPYRFGGACWCKGNKHVLWSPLKPVRKRRET
jgi:hypothetical protein